ncbi:MAG TPA: hypothetical protein VNL92_00855 [Dehalococcoidia bacterium]|nr:hypothetical protein [Dehalococcoidia bacterium]
MPVGGGVLIDRAQAYDLIDELRVALSDGFAPPVLAEPAANLPELEALRRAESDARSQLIRAEEEITRLRRELDARVAGQEVTRIAEERSRTTLAEAEERSRSMLTEAEDEAQRIRGEAEAEAAERLAQAARVAAQQLEEADTYALQLLQRLEDQIQLFLENVRTGITQLEGKRPSDQHADRQIASPFSVGQAEDDDLDDEDEEPEEDDSRTRNRRFPWLRDD